MTYAILLPNINPVAFSLGFIDIRWYGLAYMIGLFLAWFYIKNIFSKYHTNISPIIFDDFVSWAVLGIIMGGRLGHVIFYSLHYYLKFPYEIFMIWKGGMSFHGGLMGVSLATFLFCKSRKIHFSFFTDYLSIAAPIGIFFGRIANFINAELYGRTTDLPWGVVFPNAGFYARHPSQIYEALSEGILLFLITNLFFHNANFRKQHGFTTGIFLIHYAIIRYFMEFFREIEWSLSYQSFTLTSGQILSLPMFFIGIWFILKKNESTYP